MTRFYLNIYNEASIIDEEGVDHPSFDMAKAEAIAGARHFVATSVLAGEPIYESHRIEIVDEAGTLLDTVCFRDVVDLRP